MRLSVRLLLISLAVPAVLGNGTCLAQSYPAKSIRIVTSEPGGGNDFGARVIAQGLSELLDRQVVVDNRGGAGGAIAMEAVARAAPDGYTLLFYGSSIWTLPLMRKVSFDPVTDFAPISLTTTSPNILVIHPSIAVKTIKDLIALALARPGQLSYASGGSGSSTHLAAALFTAMAGVNILHVPYKGNVPAFTDLISGQVQMMFNTASAGSPYVKSGRLIGLAVTSLVPSALFPGLPVMAATVPGYEAVTPYGVLAPARTPEAIIKRLNEEIVRLMARPDVKEKFFSVGVETVGSTPEQFAATMKTDMAKLAKVIKDAGIKGD